MLFKWVKLMSQIAEKYPQPRRDEIGIEDLVVKTTLKLQTSKLTGIRL
jgi:hypothetical protein